MDWSPIQEKCFNMLGLSFSPILDQDSYIVSIDTTTSQKIRVLIRSMKFLSSEIALYLYISTKQPCMENYCHNWAGVPRCYLYMLNKLRKLICMTISTLLSFPLQPLANCQNVASLSLFYGYYFGSCSLNLLNWFHFLIIVGGLLIILIACMISATIPR